ADYWPEFAQAGKEDVTVRTLLNHRAGVVGFDEPITLDDFEHRPEHVADVCARQRPFWAPGTDQGYHGVTFGLYAAELFLRVAGETLGAFFEREVRAPLGVDAWLGLPEAVEPRVARLYPAGTWDRVSKLGPMLLRRKTAEGKTLRAILKGDSDTVHAFKHPADLGPRTISAFDTRRARALELPWVNAVANARAVATVYGALIGAAPPDLPRLVRPETLAWPMARQSWTERDRVLHKPMGFSVGFVKDEPHLFSPSVEAFGHPGAGGCLGWADPVLGFSMGYVMNRMDPRIRSPRALALARAVRESLGAR
ncbi:MAG: beta-lactamase family protein, partial [Myxococcales bacterium]|nr:beta-lactamase family protein [Myxococcales bacterium]